MIAVCGDKGSPGATAVTLALASACADLSLVVEADAWGSDLPLRINRKDGVLKTQQTVLSLAAAAAAPRDMDGRAPWEAPELVNDFAQVLSPRVNVVPGPLMAERVREVRDWAALGRAMESSSRPVFADFGRLAVDAPALEAVAAAATVVVACRGERESAYRALERVKALVPVLNRVRHQQGRSSVRVVPVVVSSRRYGPGDAADLVSRIAETDVEAFVAGVAWVAWDEKAMQALYSGIDPAKLGKTSLMRSSIAALGLVLPNPLGPDARPLVMPDPNPPTVSDGLSAGSISKPSTSVPWAWSDSGDQR